MILSAVNSNFFVVEIFSWERHFYSMSVVKTVTTLIMHSKAKNRKQCTLFRNKRFMLDKMTQRNASKFAIFFYYENPYRFCVFHFVLLLFFPQ